MENNQINVCKEKNSELSLYIHIPFCERKCNYCDFLSFSLKDAKEIYGLNIIDEYINMLTLEIKKFGYICKGYLIKTIYIGGGTPSCIDLSQISKVVDAIKNSFNLLEDIEFTIEANPSSLSIEKARGYFDLGINRLSIGGQSFIDSELKLLGRLHRAEEIKKSF